MEENSPPNDSEQVQIQPENETETAKDKNLVPVVAQGPLKSCMVVLAASLSCLCLVIASLSSSWKILTVRYDADNGGRTVRWNVDLPWNIFTQSTMGEEYVAQTSSVLAIIFGLSSIALFVYSKMKPKRLEVCQLQVQLMIVAFFLITLLLVILMIAVSMYHAEQILRTWSDDGDMVGRLQLEGYDRYGSLKFTSDGPGYCTILGILAAFGYIGCIAFLCYCIHRKNKRNKCKQEKIHNMEIGVQVLDGKDVPTDVLIGDSIDGKSLLLANPKMPNESNDFDFEEMLDLIEPETDSKGKSVLTFENGAFTSKEEDGLEVVEEEVIEPKKHKAAHSEMKMIFEEPITPQVCIPCEEEVIQPQKQNGVFTERQMVFEEPIKPQICIPCEEEVIQPQTQNGVFTERQMVFEEPIKPQVCIPCEEVIEPQKLNGVSEERQLVFEEPIKPQICIPCEEDQEGKENEKEVEDFFATTDVFSMKKFNDDNPHEDVDRQFEMVDMNGEAGDAVLILTNEQEKEKLKGSKNIDGLQLVLEEEC